MPAIETYSPRKVTEQNKDLLPSTHDPKKRTTYVQITLNEPEIKEAIRNYIRAQIPVSPNDELPVRVIAGRGENGHSAEITVSVGEYTVISPGRPTAPMATFEAAAEDAIRRNAENAEESDSESPDTEVAPSKKVKASLVEEDFPEEVSFEPQDEAAQKAPPKKSSLFENTVPKTDSNVEAAKAAASPPETEHSKGVDLLKPETEAPVEKKRAKSIFDA